MSYRESILNTNLTQLPEGTERVQNCRCSPLDEHQAGSSKDHTNFFTQSLQYLIILVIITMKVYNSFLAGGLIVGAMAGVSPPSSDPPMAYFDPYGKPGCREGSQGLYTITQTQDSICYVFPTTIQSAFVASIISGCVGESSTTINQRNATPAAC